MRVAKIIPPSKLWRTILRCSALRSASWTVSLRSKTMSLLKNEPSVVLREIIDASSRSHGSGWRREKSSRKKQLPRKPDKKRPTPTAHIGHAPKARQREAWWADGDAKASKNTHKKAADVMTM